MSVTESPVVRRRPPAETPARTHPLQRPCLTPALFLKARLPNSVTVKLECDGQGGALVKGMIEALGALMFRFGPDVRIYLHRNAVDSALGINGLVALVEQSMQLDPFARGLFMTCPLNCGSGHLV